MASRHWSEHPLPQIVLARLREFTREPEAVFWVCVFPVMMVIALGLAFRNQRVEEIQVDLVGEPALVKQAAEILKADKRMNVTAHQAAADGEHRLRTAKTSLLVRIIASEGSEPNYKYQFELDPTRAESVLAKSAVDDVLQRGAGRKDPVTTEQIERTEPGGRYIDFLVPGLLGMSLMGGGLWGIGFVTVDMRIRKLLKRFLGTPMKKSTFLGGLMLARLIFLLPEVLILLLFSHFVFEVRVVGSYFDLFLLILLGAFAFSGIGLLVASRANTIEMVTGLMNLVMVPMWIFSGIFFSPERYPDWMQPFIQALPLTAQNNLLRAVMQEGDSMWQHPLSLAILLSWGIVTFVIGLKIFKWN
jgi:ABC-2 type transport system permease protein